jgi:hypothetical protein
MTEDDNFIDACAVEQDFGVACEKMKTILKMIGFGRFAEADLVRDNNPVPFGGE